jgi:hypothetical protein
VVLLPIDRLLWTERTSRIAAGLAKTLPKPLPVQRSPAAVDRMIRKLAGRCEKLHCCYEDAVLIKAEPWSASRLVWSADGAQPRSRRLGNGARTCYAGLKVRS